MGKRRALMIYNAPCRFCHELRDDHVDNGAAEQCLFQSTTYKPYYSSVMAKHVSPDSRIMRFVRFLDRRWVVTRHDSRDHVDSFGIYREELKVQQYIREQRYRRR